MKRWKIPVLVILAFCVFILGYFIFVFLLTFQLLGPPVRNNEYGWLGPTPRKTSCIQDIGKVSYWNCSDVSIFRKHRLGCNFWLRLNGLS
jgi:hypothetical protein